jgi:hypothetical protein
VRLDAQDVWPSDHEAGHKQEGDDRFGPPTGGIGLSLIESASPRGSE